MGKKTRYLTETHAAEFVLNHPPAPGGVLAENIPSPCLEWQISHCNEWLGTHAGETANC